MKVFIFACIMLIKNPDVHKKLNLGYIRIFIWERKKLI